MKKNVFNRLLMIAVMLLSSCVFMGEIDAMTLKVKSKPTYNEYGFGAHKWVMNNGSVAFCLKYGANGPAKGDKYNCSTSTDGGLLYLLEASTGQSGNKDLAIRQAAIWKYLNNKNMGNSTVKAKVKTLVNAAKNNKGYTHNPAVSIGKLTPTLVNGQTYYETNFIRPGTANITSGRYSVSVSGVSGAVALNSNNQAVSSLNTSESFKVRVPAASLRSNATVAVDINATGTQVTALRCTRSKDSSKYQPLGFSLTNTSASAATARTTFTVAPVAITIKKVDSDDTSHAIPGAKYRIYSDQKCQTPLSGYEETDPTNSNGIVTIYGLTQGTTYYIKETTPPSGYAAPENTTSNPNCKPAKIGDTVTFSNKKNFIRIIKKEKNSNNKLDGATFALYSQKNCGGEASVVGDVQSAIDGKTIRNLNTANGGIATFEGMPTKNSATVGNSSIYYVKEITAPDGYWKDSSCKAVSVNTEVTFENTKVETSKIVIQKRDSFTKFGIDGVKIGLFSDAKCENAISGEQATTSDGGQVSFDVEYESGTSPTFYAQEIEISGRYIPKEGRNKKECKAVKVNSSENHAIIYNSPYGNIKVLKTEINNTEKVLSGIEFALLDENKQEAVDIDNNKVTNQKTDENGNLEFKNIRYGTYYLKEVSTGGKYKLVKDPIKFVLNSNTDSINLAIYSDKSFRYGDLDGDGYVKDEDLLIYNNIVADPDAAAELSPTSTYGMYIEGKNLSQSRQMVEYYINYIYHQTDQTKKTAVEKYASYAESLCSMVGSDKCSADNLNNILDTYSINKPLLVSYANAYSTWRQNHDVYLQEKAEYDKNVRKYNQYCLVNNTEPENGNVQNDSTVITDENGDPVDCDALAAAIASEPVEPLESAVCDESSYLIMGDVNKDCKINDEDVAKYINGSVTTDNVRGDLNNDDVINSKDLDIITRYLDFVGRTNSEIIFESIIRPMMNNKEQLCSDGTASCTLDNELLILAINNVGKSGKVPANVAKASTHITNELITMKISKYQVSKSVEIPGAKIIIRDSKNNKILEYTSTNKPKEFTIPAGKYTLTEKVAPEGYKTLTTTISFTVNEDGSVKLTGAKSNMYTIKKGTDNHLIIYNEYKNHCTIENGKYYGKNGTQVSKATYQKQCAVKVPDTGSNVKIISIVTGVILVSGGGFLLYRKFN